MAFFIFIFLDKVIQYIFDLVTNKWQYHAPPPAAKIMIYFIGN